MRAWLRRRRARSTGAEARRGEVTIVVRNHLAGSLRLARVSVAVDGRRRSWRGAAPPELPLAQDVALGPGVRLAPGEHSIDAEIVVRGAFVGVFAYLNDREFTTRARHRFAARDGLRLVVHAYERGDVPLERRPSIRFIESAPR